MQVFYFTFFSSTFDFLQLNNFVTAKCIDDLLSAELNMNMSINMHHTRSWCWAWCHSPVPFTSEAEYSVLCCVCFELGAEKGGGVEGGGLGGGALHKAPALMRATAFLQALWHRLCSSSSSGQPAGDRAQGLRAPPLPRSLWRRVWPRFDSEMGGALH